VLREQIRAELLRYVRSPILSVFTLALPIVIYVFVGLGAAGAGTIAGIPARVYLLAGFAAYGVSNVMLSTFGIGLTVDRARRMDVLMRATPLRPAFYLLARAVVALLFGAVAFAVVGTFAAVAGGVHLAVGTWAALGALTLVGSLPFLALGLAIGYQINPNAGAVGVNLIGLPLYFAAGVFRPLSQLPPFIQNAAPFLPTYHYAQLAWTAVGASGLLPLRQNLVWLLVYTGIFGFLAVRGYRRQEARRFA
jgi:ABC-2 type transport system permease protein